MYNRFIYHFVKIYLYQMCPKHITYQRKIVPIVLIIITPIKTIQTIIPTKYFNIITIITEKTIEKLIICIYYIKINNNAIIQTI